MFWSITGPITGLVCISMSSEDSDGRIGEWQEWQSMGSAESAAVS